MISKVEIFNEDRLKMIKEYSKAVLQGVESTNIECTYDSGKVKYCFDMAEAMVEEFERRYGKE